MKRFRQLAWLAVLLLLLAQVPSPAAAAETEAPVPELSAAQEEEPSAVPQVSGLRSTNCSATSITLSWTQSEGIIGYEIYRSKEEDTFQKVSVAASPDITFYNDSSLKEDTEYQYYVRAYDCIDGTTCYGERSDILYVRTMAKTQSKRPAQVTGLTVERTTVSAVKLSWDAVPGCTGYGLYRSDSRDGAFEQVKRVGSDQTTAKDSGLQSDTKYYYLVRAYVKQGSERSYGDASAVHSAKTDASGSGGIVTTQREMNLRSGPGVDYRIVTTVPEDVQLYADTSEKADGKWWYSVCYEQNGNSFEGYLYGDYLSVQEVAHTAAVVNLRSGPGANYRKLKTLPSGLVVAVQSETYDGKGTLWYEVQVEVDGMQYSGYCCGDYIDG